MAETAMVVEQRTHEQKLDLLAEVAVKVGLGLAVGQELVMTASLDALPLARRITEQAYKAGASLVTTLYSDDEAALMRYRLARDESFDKAAKWLYDGMGAAFKSGAARLAIAGGNPALLSNEDPEKVGRANRAVSKAYRPALELITRHEINWTIVACATPAWAAQMFPDAAPDEAIAKLWDAIFATTRIDADDPVSVWKKHDADLQKRAAYLNEKRYAALHYRGPGTDFRLGLADDHLWMGGGTTAGNGSLLHSEYADGRSVHDATQGSGRRNSDVDEAAVAPGDDDRGHSMPVREGPDRGGSCEPWDRKCCRGSSTRMKERDDWARWRWYLTRRQ